MAKSENAMNFPVTIAFYGGQAAQALLKAMAINSTRLKDGERPYKLNDGDGGDRVPKQRSFAMRVWAAANDAHTFLRAASK